MIVPKVKLIVAADLADGIGYRGGLPWPRIPKDLAHFRRLTSAHGVSIVVGRKTAETLPILSGRSMYVISRTASGAVRSPEEAIRLAADAGDRTLYVCGGAEVYRAFLPYASEIFWTTVLDIFPADTKFPSEALDPEGWETAKVLHEGERCRIFHLRRRQKE